MIHLLISLVGRFRKTSGAAAMPKVALLTGAILWFAASGLLYFELETQPDLGWSDALWWAIVTMTTVGYGDIFPTSFGGRYLIAIPTMVFGISILGYLLSMVASFLIDERARELKGLIPVQLNDHVLIIHFPSAARVMEVVAELRSDPLSKDRPVVIVDEALTELPAEFTQHNVRFVHGNPTSEQVLNMACAGSAAMAVILASDPHDRHTDHASLGVTLTLEALWPSLHTVAECVDPSHVELLERCGCDSVVCMDRLASRLLVQEALDPGVKDLIHEITSNTYGQQLYMLPGRAGIWSAIRSELEAVGALPLGLRRDGKMLLNPAADLEVTTDDKLVCIAADRPT